MAINVDKRLTPSPVTAAAREDELDIVLPEDDELDYEVMTEEEQDDGGVIVDFDPDAGNQAASTEHDVNLAEFIEDDVLSQVSGELVQAFKDDKKSRENWEKSYRKGLTLLGLNIEERTQPWAGASGVFHPILAEATVKFQADAMTETFPAAGPVLTKVVGKEDRERTKQAKRVQHDMNYYCTEVMTEYRDEHEQALLHLPLAGSIFKKAYFDTEQDRPTSRMIMADDFVVAYGTSDLQTCPRATHVMKEYPNQLRKKQFSGEYRMVDVPAPTVEYTDTEEKEAKVSGETPSAEKDDRHTILEIHVDYDLPGFEHEDEEGEPTGLLLPYRITIDMSSGTVLSVYRNWTEGDETYRKYEFFVHYKYLPGLGFYGIGLTHLLGGIAKSATSILRQLIDAGTLANLPSGLKSRGLRIKGDDSPLRPGEFRDVDVPGGAIKDNITFLPYKEPSTVLYQLLGSIIEEGRNIASIADLKISDMNSQAPVGTTLAILERGMKVMSGVHARIHASMRQEFKLIAKLIRDYGPEEYEYNVEDGASRAQDYDDRVDVFPVSNPNASTMAHRIMRHQAILQLSASAPHIYDQKELHRQMIEALGEDNPEKLIPLEEEMKPMDPVAENMAIMTGKPVKAHDHQDHESHIRVHMAAAEDPKLQQIIAQSPAAQAIAAAGAAHIQEHVAFQYRREIEKQLGVPMPKYGEEIPAEVEVNLSKLAADAADKLLRKDQAEAQALKNAEAQNDPVLQLQRAEAETKRAEVERKGMADRLRTMLGMQQIASKEKMHGFDSGMDVQREIADKMIEIEKLRMENARLRSQEQQAGARLGVDIVQGIVDDAIERERIASQEKQAELRAGTDVARIEQQREASQEQQETARVSAMTNIAGRMIDTFRSRPDGTKDGQSENK